VRALYLLVLRVVASLGAVCALRMSYQELFTKKLLSLPQEAQYNELKR